MQDVTELQAALVARNASWSAGPTKLSNLTVDRYHMLGGAREQSVETALRQASGAQAAQYASTAMPPPKVDWRDKDGNWVSPVRDQGLCQSCVAFATCAVMESSLRIIEDQPSPALALAPGPLFFCGHPDGCAIGRYASDVMAAARHGVGLEADAPYSVDDQTCQQIEPALRVTGIRYGTGDARARKFFVADEGPVYAEMRLFEDFVSYTGGVYRHFQGNDRGLHAVVIVGYDDTESCWIGMNSWGSDIQENGFFRIGYGECEIDTRPFIALDVERVAKAVT